MSEFVCDRCPNGSGYEPYRVWRFNGPVQSARFELCEECHERLLKVMRNE